LEKGGEKDKDFVDIKQLAMNLGFYENHFYEIVCEFGQGISLPYKADFKVRVHFGDITFMSDAPLESSKKGYNRWSWRLPPTVFKSKHKNFKTLDKVFV